MDFDALKKLKSSSITFSTDSKTLTINNDNGEMTIWDKYKDETTYYQDLDNNGKYDTKVVVSGQTKPSIFKLDEKQNNILQVQKQTWEQFNKESEQERLDAINRYKKFGIDINGKIDDFKQCTAENVGDCWLLAGLEKLSLPIAGQRVIKKAISQDEKGNVTVYLNGVNESYTFSPEEIIKAKGRLSTGDDDIRAIEMAVEQHRLKLIRSGKGVKTGTPSEPCLDKRIGNGSLEHPLNGGNGDEIVFLLTGKKSEYYSSSILKRLFDNKYSSDISNLLSKIQNNTGKYTASVSFKQHKGEMVTNHAYSIMMVDKDYVIIVNPWDSSKEIKIKRKDFIDNYEEITFSGISE